ncbi:NAD(P)H-hydrate dehydratase [Falsihalocynthiibacter sp. S25ZX9]|uniref:NAD(P)H-hydrate dehydratase n=1 Tax=Falsihalocynthiibacter sp. S25ZX9 TaxID=3240870 RepID=UPI00350ED449
MTDLITAAQMRGVEQAAITSGAVTGLELMERAGRGVVAAIFEEWPEFAQSGGRAVVLCGPGNNGGDGFVIARLLRDWGWEVEVCLWGDPARLPPDAKANYVRWCALGAVHPLGEPVFEAAELVVDALFGTGLTRKLEGLEKTALAMKDRGAAGRPKVVAVDVPSGLSADSGRYVGEIAVEGRISADLTVSFHRAKTGHYLADGPAACGRLVVKDIGLDGFCVSGEGVRLASPNAERLQKRGEGHKFSHGHAFVLCGGVGHGGAARLAARGALRIGAGLVTLGCPPAAILENACQLNAVMLARVADRAGLTEILEDSRINALCVGPGLGSRAETRGLVRAVLLARRASVVDADGLSAFATAPADLFEMLHEACVLTPHAGEFARLFPDIAEHLSAECTKVDAVREAAARAGCVVLLKGADTVIATPEGRACINAAAYERAAPWLATAGSGDVLAGFITGLLARGFAPYEAAQTAAWLHVDCARTFGPGLISEDLPEILPSVLRRLHG